MNWIDVSLPLRERMQHWPGDPQPEFALASDMGRGDACNLRTIRMSAHTGTHVDAPLHYLAGGASLDAMPPDVMTGEARVIATDTGKLDAAVLGSFGLRSGERVLFRTRNSDTHWCGSCFRKQYVHVTPDGARLLAETGIRMVGVDYLSVGAYGAEGDETHRILLGAGVWIVEGLVLTEAKAGRCEFLCLPLRIEGADGAPARALLRALL